MKKYVLLFSIFLITISILLLFDNDEKTILTNNNSGQLINTNALTMMYETEAGSGEYQVSSSNVWPQDGYIFNAELSGCENGSTLAWDDENKIVMLQANVSDKCYVYFDKESTFAEYIINNVYMGFDGENGLYYHDGEGSYINVDQEAGDNSYRYAGTNPNNYVCFGSDVQGCPDSNLYRIIGVFDEDSDGEYNVKLIKNTSIGEYAWDTNNLYYWENASLKTFLNTTFINEFDSSWKSKIKEAIWYLEGDIDCNGIIGMKTNYINEITKSTKTIQEKIGLIYVSDYGYAASPDHWTTDLTNYEPASNDIWLNGNNEWTITNITRLSEFAEDVHVIFTDFVVGSYFDGKTVKDLYAVRPVFYLNSDVKLTSGIGTQTDPYRIV